jgi:hypothetical protein
MLRCGFETTLSALATALSSTPTVPPRPFALRAEFAEVIGHVEGSGTVMLQLDEIVDAVNTLQAILALRDLTPLESQPQQLPPSL